MVAEPTGRRRKLRGVLAALVPALAVLGYASAPDRARVAAAYFRSDPGACVFTIAITPPTGIEWNPAFELRTIRLHSGSVHPIRLSRWPETGRPRGADVAISERQAEGLLDALARLQFFDQAVERVPTPDGAHCLIRVQGPPIRESRWRAAARRIVRPLFGPSVLSPEVGTTKSCALLYDWDARRIVGRLRTIRRGLDGDAARQLDAMIRQLPSVPR